MIFEKPADKWLNSLPRTVWRTIEMLRKGGLSDGMNKFTLLRAGIGISFLKINPIIKEMRKYYNSLTLNCICLYPSMSRNMGRMDCTNYRLCTKMCTKLARLVYG